MKQEHLNSKRPKRFGSGRRAVGIVYIICVHAALVVALSFLLEGNGTVTQAQAEKIAKGEAFRVCVEEKINSNCDGMRVKRIANRYIGANGSVLNGHYFEASTQSFRERIVLDLKGELVLPTPLPVD